MTGEIRAQADIVVIGGGVAGLWVAQRARALGYSVVILQQGPLGDGQSAHSHVYLHLGHIYRNSSEHDTVADLKRAAQLWDAWLADNPPDLEGLAEPHEQSLFGFASAADAREVANYWDDVVDLPHVPAELPDVLAGGCVVELRAAAVRCLNARWMTEALARPLDGAIVPIRQVSECRQWGSAVTAVLADGTRPVEIECEAAVLCAGAGNEGLLAHFPHAASVDLRNRRSWMLVVRGQADELPPFSGILALGDDSLFIVSRCLPASGETVWLVSDACDERLDTAGWVRQVLDQILRAFPSLKPHIETFDWGVYPAPKAEVKPPGTGARVVTSSYIHPVLDNVWALWPMKLTLAPLAAERMCALIGAAGIAPRHPQPQFDLPAIEIAAETWETIDLAAWSQFATDWTIAPPT